MPIRLTQLPFSHASYIPRQSDRFSNFYYFLWINSQSIRPICVRVNTVSPKHCRRHISAVSRLVLGPTTQQANTTRCIRLTEASVVSFFRSYGENVPKFGTIANSFERCHVQSQWQRCAHFWGCFWPCMIFGPERTDRTGPIH